MGLIIQIAKIVAQELAQAGIIYLTKKAVHYSNKRRKSS